MEQSLIAAVSGIEANQTYLDVVGNNVANANTTGYKAENADFTDLLSEQIAGASAPPASGQGAGINPLAIGTGVRVGAVTNDLTQGPLIQTNQPTDVAIQGQGYLEAVQNGQTFYTRAGNLTLDANGNLATATGGLVQGWQADANGNINPNGPTGPLNIPTGTTMGAHATGTFNLAGNLQPWTGTPPAPASADAVITANAYDSLGNTVPVTLTFAPGGNGSWTLQGTYQGASGTVSLWPSPGIPVTFDATTGQLTQVNGQDATKGYTLKATGINGAAWAFDFPAQTSSSPMTQYSGSSAVTVTPDGYGTGTLAGFTIGSNGVISGSFTNGKTMQIGQLALATFSNPGGLADQGNMMFSATANSGQANVGQPATGGRGSLIGGSLEGSNVDLATQLTDLIVAQEAYQANTKVVSTTATNLQALVQMA